MLLIKMVINPSRGCVLRSSKRPNLRRIATSNQASNKSFNSRTIAIRRRLWSYQMTKSRYRPWLVTPTSKTPPQSTVKSCQERSKVRVIWALQAAANPAIWYQAANSRSLSWFKLKIYVVKATSGKPITKLLHPVLPALKLVRNHNAASGVDRVCLQAPSSIHLIESPS